MKFLHLVILFLIFLVNCTPENDNTLNSEDEKSGGETSIFGTYIKIFQQPAANLNANEIVFHREADAAFGDIFVTAPSVINGGLGPIFNQNSCESCHVSNGRSPFPTDPSDLRGLLLRISAHGADVYSEPLAVANFGGQLQTKALFGKVPEANLTWQDVEKIVSYIDGEKIRLTQPVFSVVNAYLPFPSDANVSPRIAPAVIGLGLLEAISDKDILASSDPADDNRDGISGRPNMVWDYKNKKAVIGRFGWKATQPNLFQQTAAAYNQDMGITNPYFPTESSHGQSQIDSNADDPEIDQNTLRAATFYAQSLAVPARRNTLDALVIKGKNIFIDIKCGSCHNPKFITSQHSEYLFLSNQTIFPYTDLLLHDMGDGLADHRPDFVADGREWRTPPLWGIGLTKIVGGPNANYLHDGRAKTLEEAIMWHGGEAEKSKENFRNLSKADRNALIKFLESL